MKTFRKIIFWLHLCSGVLAGIFIFIMCVTGALLAFESNILEFAESDMRVVEISSENAERLSASEIIEKVRQAKPECQTFGNNLSKRKNFSRSRRSRTRRTTFR